MEQSKLKEIEEMQNYLELTTSGDPNEYVERLQTLSVYMARSGKLLSEAKREQEEATATAYMDNFKTIKDLSASLAKDFIKSKVAEKNEIVSWLDRINSSCTHQSENLRTLLSYAKQEMQLTRSGY